jgi:hypothetical protein
MDPFKIKHIWIVVHSILFGKPRDCEISRLFLVLTPPCNHSPVDIRGDSRHINATTNVYLRQTWPCEAICPGRELVPRSLLGYLQIRTLRARPRHHAVDVGILPSRPAPRWPWWDLCIMATGTWTVAVPQGVYLVKVDSTTAKVMVK